MNKILLILLILVSMSCRAQWFALNRNYAGITVTCADLSVSSYSFTSNSPTNTETTPSGVWFSNDGTKYYINGRSTGTLYQLSCVTPWDIAGSSYDAATLTINQGGSLPWGSCFSEDGLRVYVVNSSDDNVHSYTLTTAWDISTGSYDSVTKALSPVANPTDIQFSIDGTKMFILNLDDDDVYQFSLTTAWDISTASYDNASFSCTTEESTAIGMYWCKTGLSFYISGDATKKVFEYNCTSAWDISTASYSNNSYTSDDSNPNPYDTFFNPEGSVLYICNSGTDRINQFE